MDEMQQEQVSLFFMLLWSLWKMRNNVLWKGEECNVPVVLGWACSYLEEYKKLHQVQKTDSHRERIKWRCPPSGRLKMNIDGAYVEEGNKGGVGVVVRDDEGVGIAALARPYKYAMSPFAMEMLALRDGLRLATQQGWSNFYIESDFILLISAMNERNGDLSENGTFIADCLKLSEDCNVISYAHINREANQVADRLASVACGRGVDQVWFHSMSSIILDALFSDSLVNVSDASDLARINNTEEGVLPAT